MTCPRYLLAIAPHRAAGTEPKAYVRYTAEPLSSAEALAISVATPTAGLPTPEPGSLVIPGAWATQHTSTKT